jgi:uncharacterized protein YgiM (DUF1202 family)
MERKLDKKYCKVITEYISAFPEPLLIKKGESLRIENKKSEWPGWVWCINNDGNEGWIPKSYLKLKGKQYIVIKDYDATELTVSKGQELLIEKEESGWIWVSDKKDNQGWIPLENVKIIKK